MQELTLEGRNKMAAMYGLLLGVYCMIYATIAYQFASSIAVMSSVKAAGYCVFLVILGFTAARIRKANGGYMSFKESFGTIFVIVLVAGFLYFVYNYIYLQYIDPGFPLKMKTATLQLMEKMGSPEEALNKVADEMDKQIADSKSFNFKNNLLAYFGNLLVDCLCGLLIALIVKREKPAFEQ